MPADRSEYAHRLWAQAFDEGDVDAVVALYEPGATLVHQPGEDLILPGESDSSSERGGSGVC